MNHIFIVNPISGNGNYKSVIEWVHDYFNNHPTETYKVILTDAPGHAKEIASRYGDNDILYAVGGDGTAHEVLNGMNLSSQLAIIPSGTGNDFYRNVSKDKDLKNVLIATINGSTKTIDLGVVGDELFLNVVNLGIDARINKRVNESRNNWFPRKMAYIVYALVEVFQKYAQPIEVEVEGQIIKSNALLASFMNGKWYGGGFKSGPFADLEDGLLEMSIVDDMPLWKILTVLPKYFKGTHTDLDVVNYRRITKATIRSSQPIVVGVDGEVFEDYSISVDIKPKALTLRVPIEHI